MNLTEFAKTVGLTEQAVSKGIASGRIPEELLRRDKRKRVIEIFNPPRARLEWDASTAISEHGGESNNRWRAARARREEAQAKMTELDLAERAGRLVRMSQVESRIVTLFSACRTKLLGIPTRAKQQDPELTREQLSMLEELIREALEDLADGGAIE